MDVPLPSNSTVDSLAAACGATPGCTAFSISSSPKAASLKRYADCGWGSDYCVYPQGQPFPAADHTDLYILDPAPPPEWAAEVAAGTLLYGSSSPVPNICSMPEVGNGFVASIVGFSSTHVAGLFSGGCGTTHKARLPSPIAGISVTNAGGGQAAAKEAALDTLRGVFKRRYHFPTTGAVVEQRIVAHRTRRHVLMTELELIEPPRHRQKQGNGNDDADRDDDIHHHHHHHESHSDDGGGGGGSSVVVELATLLSFSGSPEAGLPGNGCAGTFVTTDITWEAIDHSDNRTVNRTVRAGGRVSSANDDGTRPAVAMVVDAVPPSVTLSLSSPGQATVRFVAVVTSDLEGGPAAASLDALMAAATAEHKAVSAIGGTKLLDEHVQAWLSLTSTARINIGGGGGGGGGGGAQKSRRALELQSHFSSSYYYLLSTIRADWSKGGMSPGGLASQNYEGAVFMDQEFYMAQALLLFHPELTRSAARFRIDSAAASGSKIAQIFGYKGVMFAWTAAASGNPFGCCDGKGGFENCIEQHITPDVSFFLMQIYRATGDLEWLRNEAWPVIKGVAEWIMSRVSKTTDPTNGGKAVYHVRKVMPIDEWCDQKQSGCANPGVDDDPQMNAVSKVAMLWAVEAAHLVGLAAVVGRNASSIIENNSSSSSSSSSSSNARPPPPPPPPLDDPPPIADWQAVASGMLIPYNETLGPAGGVHAMPKGVVTGPHSTSCPEDVNYLTYPMGPMLNTSSALSRRDMQYWAGGDRTCLENPGMTAPIHAISWLKVQPPNTTGAEAALNRSMLAAVFGPMHVRNEVDPHNLTVGGHYNNTHFLTGDGGFVQILLNGYAGLMLGSAEDRGMRLHPPVVPHGVDGGLGVVGLRYQGWTIDYAFDAQHMRWNASRPGLCLFRPPFGRGDEVNVGVGAAAVTEVEIGSFFRVEEGGREVREEGGGGGGGVYGKVGACSN
eukprot:g5903.t1